MAQSPEWKQFKNVRKEMEQRQMSVSVIQAINRICCRHVIDAEGNCPAANVFIVLPQDAMGDAILDDIKVDMPGIHVKPWDFELGSPEGEEAAQRQFSRPADRVHGKFNLLGRCRFQTSNTLCASRT